jgi:hypothetical protein
MDGIITGLLGTSMYDIAKKCLGDVITVPDEDLLTRIDMVIKNSAKTFFAKYKNEFGSPENSFLARQENIETIFKWLYYDSDFVLADKIIKSGEHYGSITREALNEFTDILTENMKKDYKLDKIITQKGFMKNTDRGIDEILSKITQIANNYNNGKRNADGAGEWTISDFDGNNSVPYRQGEKYTLAGEDGGYTSFMMKDNSIFVDIKAPDMPAAYYELDLDGNIKSMNPPYNINEYTIEIPQNDVIGTNVLKLRDGYTCEVYKLKWGRLANIFYDANHKMVDFKLSGGWYMNHKEKKITIG